MTPIPINIAVEDLLSEAVVRRLLYDTGQPFAVGVVYSRNGFGYLKNTAHGWNNAARSTPFFLLTDLDDAACPQSLRKAWISEPIHPNLLFRVAVREVESWLLADRLQLSKFFRVPQTRVPSAPDELADPKAALVSLASKSPLSEIKRRIVPRTGTTAKQGRDYNSCLIEFVGGTWNSSAAAKYSPSLERCKRSLQGFSPTW